MNVGHLLSRAALRFGDQVALIQDDDRQWSFNSLEKRSNQLANALLGIGLEKGDRVAVLFGNEAISVEVYMALAKSGLVRVTLNHRETVVEHAFKIHNSGCKALIFGQRTEKHRILQISEALEGDQVKWLIGAGSIDRNIIDYEAFLGKASDQPPEIDIRTNDIYRIAYTGGTTGRPKGVMLTHLNEMVEISQLLFDIVSPKPGDVMLHAAPIAHGSGAFVLPHLIRGAVNLSMSKYDPEEFCRLVQTKKVTTTFLVPTMIGMLLESPLKNYQLSSLHTVVYGASPMPVERITQAIERFGPIFVQLYGQTEAPMSITRLLKEEHIIDGSENERKRLGSAGTEFTLSHVRIVDENGDKVQNGSAGEIVTSGPHVMQGYWDNPKETQKTIKSGWLHTGDIGVMDERGFVYVLDRRNDLIITGGFNVYPREVEEVLYNHPEVLDAVVIGVPDEKWGEKIKAFVQTKKGQREISADEVISFCRKRLAGYKIPKKIEFVSELPKSPAGKILRRELKDREWKNYERRVH
jgi:long-chain acyl-CoA synthetase